MAGFDRELFGGARPALGNTGLLKTGIIAKGGGRLGVMCPDLEESSKSWGGGFDTVELSADGFWDEGTVEGTWAALDEAKKRAGEAEGERSGALVDRHYVVGSDVFMVGAKGSGGGGGGPRMNWWLTCSGIRIGLSRRDGGSAMPNVRVVLGSEVLMWMGVERAVAEVERLLGVLGVDVIGGVRSAKVGRADFCVDLVGVGAAELTELWHSFWYVAQPSTGSAYRSDRCWTGFSMGKGNVVRVYDKEFESRSDDSKRAFLIEHRWGGVVPEKSARVEFQCRREMLVSMGVDTVDDLLARAGGCVAYLTTDWFRLTLGEPDHSHADRSIVLPVWELVSCAFSRVFGEQEPIERKAPERIGNRRVLVRMAAGVLSSLAAIRVGRLVVSSASEVERVIRDECGALVEDIFRRCTADFKNYLGRFEDKCHEAAARAVPVGG